MDKKMNFKYFYGTEADQFSFYRIPKALFWKEIRVKSRISRNIYLLRYLMLLQQSVDIIGQK